MITNDAELQSTMQRIAWFQQQVAQLGKVETNPLNYNAATLGFISEIDRMQIEVASFVHSINKY